LSANLNLYEQQRRNRERTALFLAAMVIFLAVLGLGADGFLYGAGGSPGLPICTIGALAFGGLSAWWALASGDRAILESATARPVNVSDPAERTLDDVVEEMAIAAGLPKPAVWVIPDSDPNAFATGPGPARASIAVTRGAIDTLNREELQGVVAHEMSHVRNLDIRLMTVVAALAGAILLVADASRRGLRWGGGRTAGRREGRSGLFGIAFFLLWIISLLLAPIIARLVALGVSRQREYLADASGAELTRNPLALASALEKIDAAVAPTPSIKQGVAHLCIADPLGRTADAPRGAWASLLTTHPPIARRIALLREMAYAKPPAA
jgi:heat shock protein HtpX